MSAQAQDQWSTRDMQVTDIERVFEIEQLGYEFPWTDGIFRDCLKVGYPSRVVEAPTGQIIGYGLMSIALDEAHLLNLCVDRSYSGQGLGQWLMEDLIDVAIGRGAQAMYLEVRPSNRSARRLYKRLGFRRIGTRPDYYPSATGREDAIVYSLLF